VSEGFPHLEVEALEVVRRMRPKSEDECCKWPRSWSGCSSASSFCQEVPQGGWFRFSEATEGPNVLQEAQEQVIEPIHDVCDECESAGLVCSDCGLCKECCDCEEEEEE
jgi:hypothetical protein